MKRPPASRARRWIWLLAMALACVPGAAQPPAAADFDDLARRAAAALRRPLPMSGFQSPAVIEALGVAALTLPWLPADVPPAKRPLVQLAGSAMWALYAEKFADAETAFRQLADEYPKEPGVHY